MLTGATTLLSTVAAAAVTTVAAAAVTTVAAYGAWRTLLFAAHLEWVSPAEAVLEASPIHIPRPKQKWYSDWMPSWASSTRSCAKAWCLEEAAERLELSV